MHNISLPDTDLLSWSLKSLFSHLPPKQEAEFIVRAYCFVWNMRNIALDFTFFIYIWLKFVCTVVYVC